MLTPEKAFILSVNGGSSSIKFALFDTGTSLHRVLRGRIERIGMPAATFTVQGTNRADAFSRSVSAPDHTAAVGVLMDWVEGQIASGALAAIGHRVVHGGPAYWEAQRITPAMIETLHQLSPFDPEHLPEEILLTEAFIAVFRTFRRSPASIPLSIMTCRAWPACCRFRGATMRRVSGAMVFTASPAPTSWKNLRGWRALNLRRDG